MPGNLTHELDGGTPSLLYRAPQPDPEPLPTAVSPQLKDVVARGLQKNEKLRYGTAAEMRAAVQEAFVSSATVNESFDRTLG